MTLRANPSGDTQVESPIGSTVRSPNRTPLLLGGVGHFFAGGMAIPFAALFLAVDPSGASTTPAPAVLALGVVTILALVLHSIGFYGFWKNYKSTLAVVTFGYGLVASGVLLVAVVPAGPSAAIRSAALLVLSAMFVLYAAAYLANRPNVAHGGAPGAGVLLL